MVLRIAVPSDAPICVAALTVAAATPAWRGSTPRVPTLNAGAITQAMPMPSRISAGRTCVTKPLSTWIWVRMSIPAAAVSAPGAMIQRAGTRAGGGEGDAGDTKPLALPASSAAEHSPSADRGGDCDRHIDIQAPSPAEVLGQDAAEEKAERRPRPGDGPVDRERPGPLTRLGESDRD